MKNKNFAKIIAMSLFAAMAVNVGAIGNIELRGEDYYYDNIHSNPVYDLGTPEDETGVLLPDSGVSVASATSETELFSMTANGVTGLLTSKRSAGKNFNLSDLDRYQGIRGTLVNTYYQPLTIKVGACYYDSYSATYTAVTWAYFDSDTEGEWYWRSNNYFTNNMTYYGYINNHNNLGSVSGSITFYTCENEPSLD